MVRGVEEAAQARHKAAAVSETEHHVGVSVNGQEMLGATFTTNPAPPWVWIAVPCSILAAMILIGLCGALREMTSKEPPR